MRLRALALWAIFACAVGIPAAYAQQKTIYCINSSSTACSSTTREGNGTQGEPAWEFLGKINENFTQLYDMFGSSSNLATNGSADSADILGLFGSSNAANEFLASPSGAAGALSLRKITTTDLPSTVPVFTGSITAGDCTKWATTTSIEDAGGPCILSTVTTLADLTSANGSTIPASAGTLAGTTGTFTLSDCLEVGSTSPFEVKDAGAACGTGSAGVTSLSGDGALITNSTSTGAVTLTLGSAVGYGVWGNDTSTSGTPAYTALSSWPAAAFPTLNQNTTGTAAGLTSYPTLCTGGQFSQGLSSGSNNCATPSGSGTVTDGSGTTTANELLLSSTTAHSYTNATTLPAAAEPAHTGDVTNTAGSLAMTVSKVNGGSVPASAGCLSTNSSSQITSGCSQSINAQTGTTYTVVSGDASKLLTFSNSSAVAVTLPQAGTTGFGSGFAFTVENLGAGEVTITPTTSTINGAATLKIPQDTGCSIVSDGTNYQVGACTALQTNWLNAASSGTSVTPICRANQRLTVTTVTATGNLTIAAPTGCSEGQTIELKVSYSASDTYTWNSVFHANSANPGALPSSTGATSGVDFFIFYDDAANSRFDFLGQAPAF